MACNPLNPITVSKENPQNADNNDSALDKVVDPLIEFHVSPESHEKSPKDAFNLPGRLKRKSSSTSLYAKLDYFIDHKELPRVHRTLSSQSLSLERALTKNVLNSNFRNSSVSSVSVLSNGNSDDISLKSEQSVTPVLDLALESSRRLNSPNEKYETASNISASSNLTDVQGSILSSISDIDEQTYVNKNILEYEETIKDLRIKLQEKQAENDSYKFALTDLQWKIELQWQEKYQELLRQKANCEGQLNSVQNQYDNVLKEKGILINDNKTNEKNIFEEYTKLQLKISNLEKINAELSSKLILSTNEAKQWHTENFKVETENEKLRINLQELKIELESKNTVSQSLKNKITEQHIELQNQIQAKLKLNNFVAALSNEIESIKKSEKWYTEQLHTCQYSKNKIQQELMSTQSNLVLNTQKTDKLEAEVSYWKNTCEETRVKAMKEKERLLKRMEIIEADLIERQAILECTENYETKNVAIQESITSVENKILCDEYKDEITNLNKVLEEKDVLLNDLKKQSADFLVRVTTLQKMLNEKELSYQMLENTNSDLEMKCNHYNENIRMKENQLLELRNKIVTLEVALHAANKEKEEINDTIKIIREDFNKFMKSYNNLKISLEEKIKIINSFECEKQQLFMENNWRVCEVEELQQKVLESKRIEAELTDLKNIYNDVLADKEKITEENVILKEKITVVLNKSESILKENSELDKIKVTLNSCEKQLFSQIQNCERLTSEISEKEKEINDFKKHIDQLELTLKNGGMEIVELKKINSTLELKIQELTQRETDLMTEKSQLHKFETQQDLSNLNIDHLDANKTTDTKLFNTFSTQTDFVDRNKFEVNFEYFKLKLTEIISDNNHSLSIEQLNLENIFENLISILNDVLDTKNVQIEMNEKLVKTLKNKVFVLKSKIQERILKAEERCSYAVQNIEEMTNQISFIRNYVQEKNKIISVAVQTNDEINTEENKLTDTSNCIMSKNKYDKSNRTLLRKLKEELRSRKTAEKNLETLQDTYNFALTELNNLKLENNRVSLEYETLKSRCNEYKDICNKQNMEILSLEKERGENILKENMECSKCLELNKLKTEFGEMECKFKSMEDKLFWCEKEVNDKEKGITECKKQLFNEKIQSSALKKQNSSIQMCLDNANSLLDTKQVEYNQLKLVCEKIEASKKEISDLLENEQARYQETKRKLEESLRLLEEKTAKDELLADEIKTISCHLHQKNLELSNAESRINILENDFAMKMHTLENKITELQNNLSEVNFELEGVRNDKFFLQRLCADLKMSLQGTSSQNKGLQQRIEILQTENNNVNIKLDSLPSSDIDDDYIQHLLKESTVSPDKPLLNLRSCLDSLKSEMAILQKEIIAKTQNSVL